MTATIEVNGLRKRFGPAVALDGMTFVVRPGHVTGFVGPNGAGKSTTLRVMVGLTRPDSGTATISGRHYVDLPNPGLEVGVLLDASAQHAGRTGREILTIGAETMGLPRRRVDELLDRVSLTPTESRRRLRDYSLGMRQRLGIAHALLGDPEVLILDEPANGLDPAGIHWMRGLLRSYAADGGTVLLSSHLLHEVEKVADDLVLIGHGRIVAQGSKDDLLQTRGAYVRATNRSRLASALARAGIHTIPSGDGLRSDADPRHIGKVTAAEGIALDELRPADGAGLEDLFLQLTSTSQREGAAA